MDSRGPWQQCSAEPGRAQRLHCWLHRPLLRAVVLICISLTTRDTGISAQACRLGVRQLKKCLAEAFVHLGGTPSAVLPVPRDMLQKPLGVRVQPAGVTGVRGAPGWECLGPACGVGCQDVEGETGGRPWARSLGSLHSARRLSWHRGRKGRCTDQAQLTPRPHCPVHSRPSRPRVHTVLCVLSPESGWDPGVGVAAAMEEMGALPRATAAGAVSLRSGTGDPVVHSIGFCQPALQGLGDRVGHGLGSAAVRGLLLLWPSVRSKQAPWEPLAAPREPSPLSSSVTPTPLLSFCSGRHPRVSEMEVRAGSGLPGLCKTQVAWSRVDTLNFYFYLFIFLTQS